MHKTPWLAHLGCIVAQHSNSHFKTSMRAALPFQAPREPFLTWSSQRKGPSARRPCSAPTTTDPGAAAAVPPPRERPWAHAASIVVSTNGPRLIRAPCACLTAMLLGNKPSPVTDAQWRLTTCTKPNQSPPAPDVGPEDMQARHLREPHS